MGKYIICSCEGHAEQAIMDLLIDGERLCFSRHDLIDGKCTQMRIGKHIANTFLGIDTEKEVAILRILDRRNEKLVLPKEYRLWRNISVLDVITKPEIEIIHIIAEGHYKKFKAQPHKNPLSPSEYCKANFQQGRNRLSVKSREYVVRRYENDLDSLVEALLEYKRLSGNSFDYCLADLLLN